MSAYIWTMADVKNEIRFRKNRGREIEELREKAAKATGRVIDFYHAAMDKKELLDQSKINHIKTLTEAYVRTVSMSFPEKPE